MKLCVRWLAAFCLPLGLLLPGNSAAAGEGWHNNYEAAVAEARSTGKPLFADFSTSWCGMCKQLDAKTFTDPAIMARLDKFVKVKIDAEQRADLAKQFAVGAYPTLVSIDPNGRVVDKSEGFYTPKDLAPKLDGIMQTVAATATPAAPKQGTPELTDGRPVVAGTQISQPVIGNGRDAIQASGRRPISGFKAEDPAELEVSVSNERLPVGKPAGRTAARAGEIPSATPTSVRIPVVAKSKLTDNPNLKSPVRHTSAEIVSASATPRVKLPMGGGAIRNEIGGDGRVQLAQAAAEETPTPAAAASDEPAATEALPRPMLRTGTRPNEVEKPAPTATPKPGAAKTPVKAAATKTPETKTAKSTTAEPKTTTKKADPLATIRKLQGTGSKTDPTGSKSTPQAAETEKAEADEPASASKTPTPAAKTPTPAAKTVSNGTEKSAEPVAENATDATAQSESATSEAPVDNATTEKVPDGQTAEPTAQDVQRWMKDADAKLVAGQRKQARAMYAKVVEQDADNKHARTDEAFIKMVSLMVDQDDDALRRKALNKIKEFESRFPDSPHKDYYTLIRATLAADLGETNEAHALLESYSERFPDSKYQKLAHETWKDLPPVTKPASKTGATKSETTKKKTTSSRSE